MKIDGDRIEAERPENIKGIIKDKEGTIVFKIDKETEAKHILLYS